MSIYESTTDKLVFPITRTQSDCILEEIAAEETARKRGASGLEAGCDDEPIRLSPFSSIGNRKIFLVDGAEETSSLPGEYKSLAINLSADNAEHALYAFRVRNAREDESPDIQYLADLTDEVYRIACEWDSVTIADGDDIIIFLTSMHEPNAQLNPLMDRVTGVVTINGECLERRNALFDFSNNIYWANEDALENTDRDDNDMVDISAHTARFTAEDFKVTTPPVESADISQIIEQDNTGLPKLAGGVGMFQKWCLGNSKYPQPTLAMGAAFTAWGTAIGHRARTECGLHGNLYSIAIAPSAKGKTLPMQSIARFLQGIGDGERVGPMRISSSAGMINYLDKNPVYVFLPDEVSGMLRDIHAKGSDAYLKQIAEILLTLFSFAGDAGVKPNCYADGAKNITVNYPQVSMYGSSTPTNIFSCMNREVLTNGFISRNLFWEGISPLSEEVTKKDMPAGLMDIGKAWADFNPCNDLGMPTFKTVDWSPGVKRAAHLFQRQLDVQARSEDAVWQAVFGRVVEHGKKLALIYECAQHKPTDDFTISMESWEMGKQIAIANAEWIISKSNLVGETGFERDQNAYVDFLNLPKNKDGVTATQIARKFTKHKAKDRNEILKALMDQGRIESVNISTNGRPSTVLQAVRT